MEGIYKPKTLPCWQSVVKGGSGGAPLFVNEYPTFDDAVNNVKAFAFYHTYGACFDAFVRHLDSYGFVDFSVQVLKADEVN